MKNACIVGRAALVFLGAFSWAACNFCMMLVMLELIYPIWYNVCRIIINYTRKGVVVDDGY